MSREYVNGCGRIHVTNLPVDIKEDDILSLFNKFGLIKRVDLKYGYAYIFYDIEDEAINAINEMKGYEINGRNINIEAAFTNRDVPPSKAAPIIRSELRLRVLDIDSRVDWRNLKDWGKIVGDVHYAAAHTLQGVPIGIIEYTNEEDVEKALATLPDEPLNGKRVQLIRNDPNDGPLDPPANPDANRGKFTQQYNRRDNDFDRRRMPRDDGPRDFDRNGGGRNYNDRQENPRDYKQGGGRGDYQPRNQPPVVERYANREREDPRDNRGGRRGDYQPRNQPPERYDNRGREDYGGRGREDFGGRGREDFGGRGREDFGGRGREDFGGRGREDFGDARRPPAPRQYDDNYNRPTFERARSRSRDRGYDDNRQRGSYNGDGIKGRGAYGDNRGRY